MALINDLKLICDRLAPLGWRDLLLRVTSGGLDIAQPTAALLRAQLTAPLASIDRTVRGFDDFAPDVPAASLHGLTPASLSRSLLYHALASPLVHPAASGAAGTPVPATSYPTLEELDTVENVVFALQPFDLTQFLTTNPTAVIAVFACQYRAGGRSAHRRYADITYSRTGVARVGTNAPVYDPRTRSWRLTPATGGGTALAAMPARYAAFLAVRRRPGPRDAVLDAIPADLQLDYLFPVRKIFPGKECFSDGGMDVSLTFLEYHRNEKLRRVHTTGNIPPLPIFNLDAPPFFRDSVNEPGLVKLQRFGGSLIVVPRHGPLVRSVQQQLADGTLATVRFNVPPVVLDVNGNPVNRFDTSLEIPTPNFRRAPEYVNIRHEFIAEGVPLSDLNKLAGAQFENQLDAGNYEAAHFVDDTSDGAVLARVSGIQNAIPSARQLPAFSLVTAPDFFPNADQVTIARWATTVEGHFAQGGPRPLSANQADAAADLELLRPGTQQKAFSREERTMTHVISTLESPSALLGPAAPDRAGDDAVSWLPDAASDVFAPGWDVSLTRAGNTPSSPIYLTSYGLGSPFPEDAKLCAALNSFWPAVAPDASRTFGRLPTGIPLLDTELGLHPNHPAVATGAPSQRGWDGEFGPFFETVAGVRVINHADIGRSDYVSNALAGTIHSAGLEKVDSQEMIARMETLRACTRVLPPGNDSVPTSKLFLVEVEKIADWSLRVDRLAPQLTGPGFLFVFGVRAPGAAKVDPADETRVRHAVDVTGGQPVIHTCQAAVSGIKVAHLAFRTGTGPISSIANP